MIIHDLPRPFKLVLMDSLDLVRRAVVDASRLARAAEAAAIACKAMVTVRSRAAEGQRDALTDEAADIRFKARVVRRFGFVPGLSRIARRLELSCEDRIAARRRLDQKIAVIYAEGESVDALAVRSRLTLNRLFKAARAVEELGVPPSDVAAAAAGAQSRAAFLMKSKRDQGWAEEAEAAARLAVDAVRDWAQARMIADARRRSQEVRQQSGAATRRSARIYLPIPQTLYPMAERLGALRDPSPAMGASPFFVTHDMNFGRLQEMLPLAHRQRPTAFSFPPVPARAAGQALWGLFENEFWGHIRRSIYSASGRRCIICGGRGEGYIAEAISQPNERRQTIEAHEIWEWTAPDVRSGIGVQKLKGIVTVCPNCHAMFHEANARRLARANGMEEDVRTAIEKRRMLVNRMGRDELGRDLISVRDHLRAVSGIDKWIIDLSHLSSQHYMANVPAIMNEANRAGFPPERIAGLRFATEERSFEARSASDIYAELAGPQQAKWNLDDAAAVQMRRS